MLKKRFLSALLAVALLASGCNSVKPEAATAGESTEAITETTTETEAPATSETTKAPEPVKFNPHVHTSLLSEYVTEDMWQALYSAIDAIRAGEDTFECPDQKAYKWCTDQSVLGTFLPPSCMMVVADGFSDGTGKLKYKIDKDKYKEREEAFEEEIERMLNEAIRSDYSEFEKALGIYLYICRYFVYDYSEMDAPSVDEFSTYACITTKKGICCEIADVYSYLLLQVGVEATTYGGEGDTMYHDWTYVVVGGKGYHCDATWDLHGDYPNGVGSLDHFMMTEERRLSDGFDKDKREIDQLWTWKSDYDIERFSATDAMFSCFWDGSIVKEWDPDKNIIIYSNAKLSDQVFEYGNL